MNGTLIRRVAAVSLFLAVLVVPKASAAARVFLSGTGVDSGDCTDAANPCRSLQYAIDQAAVGAEVVIVSSGGYGGATITKSISVNAPTGVVAFVGRTITVNIASTDTVTLRGLSMNGAVFGDANGIEFIAGGTLNVENTVISAFSAHGIKDKAWGSKLWVNNCDVKKASNGIFVSGPGTSAVIENSRSLDNFNAGMFADDSAIVVIRNSVAAGNLTGTGFVALASLGATTEMIVDSCLSTNNARGLWSFTSDANSVATLRAGQNVVMNNTQSNLVVSGAGFLICHGGNRVGATGGTTGCTSTEAQQ